MGLDKSVGKIFLAIGVIIVIAIVAIFFMGFGSAKDLGVHPTTADLASAQAKLGRQNVPVSGINSPSGSLRFEGSHPVDASFTSEEFTALQQARNYKYDPLYAGQTQVKFNSDGTTEISGKIHKDNIEKYAQSIGLLAGQISQINDAASKFPGDPTFYSKGTVSVTNGQVTSSLSDLTIAGVPVPSDQIGQAKSPAEQMAEEVIAKTPGLSVQSFTVAGGQAHFVGTYPDKAYLAQ